MGHTQLISLYVHVYLLSWKWLCNDIVVMQQNWVCHWDCKISVTSNNIFDFVISESCDGGVSYAHDMWLLILLILCLFFAIVSNLLIPMKKCNPKLYSLAVLWGFVRGGGAQKTQKPPPLQQWQRTHPSNAATISFVTGLYLLQ